MSDSSTERINKRGSRFKAYLAKHPNIVLAMALPWLAVLVVCAVDIAHEAKMLWESDQALGTFHAPFFGMGIVIGLASALAGYFIAGILRIWLRLRRALAKAREIERMQAAQREHMRESDAANTPYKEAEQ